MTLEPDVHDDGGNAVTMKLRIIAAWMWRGGGQDSGLHPELLRGALVDTDHDDVWWDRDGPPKREQPPESDLFFQPQAEAGGAQNYAKHADEQSEKDALTKPHKRGL